MDDEHLEAKNTQTNSAILSPKRLKLNGGVKFSHLQADGDGAELLVPRNTFAHIAFLSHPWRNPGTTTQIITLTIRISSGTKTFYSRIVDDGEYVEIMVQRASPMTGVDLPHKK